MNNKIEITEYSQFSELPLEYFNTVNYSVYVLDKNWNYLFVNKFVTRNLQLSLAELAGKNIWARFPMLAHDPSFMLLKSNSERGKDTNLITISPINSQRLNIVGHPLKDCYLFSSSILPNKEDLINELRNELGKASSRA